MIIDQLESRFQQLGIDPEGAKVLLALPLIAVLSVDQDIKGREQEEVEAFCRQRLAFDDGKIQKLQQWSESPPDHAYIEEASQLLEALHVARDEVTVGNRALEKVMIRAEKMLRNRVLQSATPVVQGQQLLECFCQRFGIDLGMPWQNLAPEAFDDNASTHTESGIREKQPSVGISRDSSSGRGSIF